MEHLFVVKSENCGNEGFEPNGSCLGRFKQKQIVVCEVHRCSTIRSRTANVSVSSFSWAMVYTILYFSHRECDFVRDTSLITHDNLCDSQQWWATQVRYKTVCFAKQQSHVSKIAMTSTLEARKQTNKIEHCAMCKKKKKIKPGRAGFYTRTHGDNRKTHCDTCWQETIWVGINVWMNKNKILSLVQVTSFLSSAIDRTRDFDEKESTCISRRKSHLWRSVDALACLKMMSFDEWRNLVICHSSQMQLEVPNRQPYRTWPPYRIGVMSLTNAVMSLTKAVMSLTKAVMSWTSAKWQAHTL